MKSIKGTLLILVLSTLFTAVSSFAAVMPGATYYTKANIWYARPTKIPSTNYHVGTILPVGTKVDMISMSDDLIVFKDQKGIIYNIQFIPKFSGPSLMTYLNAYFSEDNILKSRTYKKMSKEEKANISMGAIAEGMSKEAVLMSYGVPPTHKTPSLESTPWTYWVNRFRTMVITFGTEDTVTVITR